jgi:hypothetical protein
MDPDGKMWERDDQLFNQMNALAGAITDSPEVVSFRFHCYLTSLFMSLSCLMLLLIQVLLAAPRHSSWSSEKGC